MMSITRDTAVQLLAILFPPCCLGCKRVEGVTALPLGLCSLCHRRLEVTDGNCGLTRPPAPTQLDGLRTGWTYRPPLDAVIRGLKYGRLEFLGRDLADALHQRYSDALLQEVDVVVPIPLHWRRRLARGFNQAEAIARPLAESLGHSFVRALRRRRSTRPQTLLDRSRREGNLRLAFATRKSQAQRIERRRVLLVDDVVTTGATLEAAARCLKTAGASSVIALAAARTASHRRGRRLDGTQGRGVKESFDKERLNSL